MNVEKDKVVAAVVTFNRLELLKQSINALRNQSKKPDAILVVNNSSTDGTGDWLAEQEDLIVVTQANLGSSGGQYTSFKTCYELGYEWLWIMDDDVVPRKDCLEQIFTNRETKKVLAPLRYSPDGKPFENDTIEFNLSNPFASIWVRVLSAADLKNKAVKADGITFEGPFFHRDLVAKIGLPEKKFFIYADDTEYFIRAQKAGYSMYVLTEAEMDRLLPAPPLEKNFTWKHYYIIRNIIAVDVLHSNFITRLLRPLFYTIKWLGRASNTDERKTVFKALQDGYFYKSEN